MFDLGEANGKRESKIKREILQTVTGQALTRGESWELWESL